MYEEDSNPRVRGNFLGYDGVNNSRASSRHEYRRASPPNRQRNPPPRDPPPRTRNRSRSPRGGFHERVYDDYAARDYNDYHDNGGVEQGYFGNDRPSRDRDDFEGDNRGREGRRSGPPSRSYRNERSNSRDMSRDRADLRDRVRDNRMSRGSGRDYQGDTRDSSRNYLGDNRSGDGDRGFRDNIRGFREDERERTGPRIIDRGFLDDRLCNRNYRNEDFADNERNARGRREDDRSGRFSDSDDRDRRRRDDDVDTDRSRGWSRDDTLSQLHAPSQTVILQNIGPGCTEEKIEGVLKKVGFDFRSIAVIRDRDTGENKGFAFVEFFDVETAEKWMEDTMREIRIDDKLVMLNYSKRKNVSTFRDWNCFKCDVLNFGSRKKYSHDRNVTCYQCGALQSEGDEEVKNKRASNRDDSDKTDACNVLMVRGMDITTTEEMIRTAITPLTNYPIYDVRLIRDKVTDISRGFAFVEMGELEHAKELLEIIEKSDPPFLIANRRITIGYARHGYNTPSGTTNKIEKSSKQNDKAGGQTSGWTDAPVQQKNISNATAVALSTANAAGAAPAAQSTYSYDATSGYYYDTSTGLYYDPNTGYHYNGTTGQWMYWTGTRYQAVNPDGTPVGSTPASTPAAASAVASAVAAQPAQITATAVPTNVTGNASASDASDALCVPNPVSQATLTTQVPPGAIPSKKDIVEMSFQKPKTARKIAKDMERWAKKMNTATEAKKVAVKAAQDELRLLAQKEEELRQQILQEVNVSSIVVANNAIASLPKDSGVRSLFVPENEEEGSVLKLGSALSTPKTKKPTSNVVAVDIPEPEDDDFVDESKFVDAAKMACLLCKRQFPSKDVLTKHLQMSQLHKDNLEKYKQSKQL